MHLAYDWAYAEPVRKVFYNLIVTGLSVAVALVIGTIELSGLIASKSNLAGVVLELVRARRHQPARLCDRRPVRCDLGDLGDRLAARPDRGALG